MNLTIDVPGVRGLEEAGVVVGSLPKVGAEVGSVNEDAAEVVGVRVLEKAIDRLNPCLNLGLVLSDFFLALEISNKTQNIGTFSRRIQVANEQILDPVEKCLQVIRNIDVLEIILNYKCNLSGNFGIIHH